MRRISATLCVLAAAGSLLITVGCGPDRVKRELRRQNQSLRGEVERLNRLVATRDAEIRRLEQQQEVTHVPTLPPERLERMFTTHELYFGRLTGGVDLDPETVGHDGLNIYIVPLDQTAGLLKAAGSFRFRVFDLKRSRQPLVGEWSFSSEEAAERWLGRALMYGYVFTLPWQELVPENEVLIVEAAFVDELSGREFTQWQEVRIEPPQRRYASEEGGPEPDRYEPES